MVDLDITLAYSLIASAATIAAGYLAGNMYGKWQAVKETLDAFENTVLEFGDFLVAFNKAIDDDTITAEELQYISAEFWDVEESFNTLTYKVKALLGLV